MRLSEYVRLDAVAQAALVAAGELRPAELEAAAREAVRAVNPAVNAVVETWPVDAGPAPDGALAGVPFLIKDIGVTMAGRRMEAGSRLLAGHVAGADSYLMTRLRRAGLAIFGRTATPELAYSITTEPMLYGATRNPWDPRRGAGGSSGGAGAAVAAGMVPIAHATDAAGSLRIPASYNGIFGLKTTRGRVSLGPGFDEQFSGLAVQGCLSRTVRDSAALLDQMRGPEPGDPYFAAQPSRPYADEVTREPGRLRVGVLAQAWGGRRTTAPVLGALDATARLLESLGHRVDGAEIALGLDWADFVLANARVWAANLAATVDGIAGPSGRPVDATTLEPVTLAGYHYGRQIGAAEFLAALAMRNQVSRSLAAFFAAHDVLLTPTVPELPPPLGTLAEGAEDLDGVGWIERVFDRSPFTVAFNVAGTPAMSVPAGVDPGTGLPIGMQFAAGHGREDLLFRLAGQLERAAPWAARTPVVRAGSAPRRTVKH
ncbi:amidase [Actinoplanes siamensis]|uniref:amidase n=1 Tax=Actinoplanes siamensis TaxID=1223317 RepID=UPI001943D513|nr:amidase [Actinoplanes siamensis]